MIVSKDGQPHIKIKLYVKRKEKKKKEKKRLNRRVREETKVGQRHTLRSGSSMCPHMDDDWRRNTKLQQSFTFGGGSQRKTTHISSSRNALSHCSLIFHRGWQRKKAEMERGSDGFVRADQIDLKSLDDQLARHLNRVLTMEKNKKKEEDTLDNSNSIIVNNNNNSNNNINVLLAAKTVMKERQEWEIDPPKLIIKTVLARGTFGTVHRGIYDGQDVAGQSPTFNFLLLLLLTLSCVQFCSLLDWLYSAKKF